MEIVNIVGPVFLVIGAGYVLGRRGLIDPATNAVLSRLVFYLAAPALLLHSAASQPISLSRDLATVLVITSITLLTAAVVYLATGRCKPARRGVLTQGSHRSNMVFVGLPIITNALGAKVIGPAAVLIGFMVVIYNFTAVIELTLPHHTRGGRLLVVMRRNAWNVLRNPLIIGSATGILLAALQCTLPPLLDRSLETVGRMAMPLALLSVGAGLEPGHLRGDLRPAMLVAAVKLLGYPALVYLGLRWVGISGPALLYPVLLMAAPTAVVSYVMAREMDGDQRLAGAIVMATTLGSLVTIPAWLLLTWW